MDGKVLLRLALYQPDIAPNAGTMFRMAACFGVAVDLIEPAGFRTDDRRLRRAAMDYVDHLDLTRHTSWDAYTPPGRLILLTTKGTLPYTEFTFAPNDTLMVGQESAGVPYSVHQSADARLVIPMSPSLRSLNVAVAAAMVLGEALRQTTWRLSEELRTVND